MELSLSGNSLKTFTRSLSCLARIGSELVLQASTSQLSFQTINASRTAYLSISFNSEFFDTFAVRPPDGNGEIRCSFLLKAVCAIFRTPASVVDRLAVILSSPDAPKIRWTLDCFSGIKKTYWITCNVEPDVHQLSLERDRYPSNFVVRPRDLSRLLTNFQSSLHEITIIASDLSADVSGGKAVELRSYIDPLKDNIDAALHTQLWIDPGEEFFQYVHSGDPVDVTFCVKELKAFLTYCEGCEADILLCFEKAGEPVLMAPKFDSSDACNADYNATLVLCTMLSSQLSEGPPTSRVDSEAEQPRAGKGDANNPDAVNDRTVRGDGSPSQNTYLADKFNGLFPSAGHVEADMEVDEFQGGEEMVEHCSNHHASNWLNEDEDDDEDDGEAFIPSTPPF